MGLIDNVLGRFGYEAKKEGPSKRVSKLSGEVKPWNFFRFGAQIETWRLALEEAELEQDPAFEDLYNIYREIVLDYQVSGAITQRILASLSSAWFIYNENGEVNEELTEKFKKAWFEDFLKWTLEAKFYGWSLIEFESLDPEGFPNRLNLIPRQHVDPRKRILKQDLGDREGISVEEEPYVNSTILVSCGLGLLNDVAPLAIWKKNALGYWSQYGELFGSPIRIVKTDVYDKLRFKNAETMAENVGAANYCVLHNEDSIELVEAGKHDVYNVYDKLADRCEAGISKILLGQTMTIDDGSSRSQSEVHNRVFNEIVGTDKKFIERTVNNELIPRIRIFASLPEGAYFAFDQEARLSLEDKKSLLEVLLPHFKISPEKIEELIDIEVEEKPEGEPVKDLASKLAEINNLYEGFKGGH